SRASWKGEKGRLRRCQPATSCPRPMTVSPVLLLHLALALQVHLPGQTAELVPVAVIAEGALEPFERGHRSGIPPARLESDLLLVAKRLDQQTQTMEFLARGLRRQAAQGGVQTRGSLLAERGEALGQKRGWAAHPGNRQAGQSRPDCSRIPGASHGPLLIPHCRVHTGPITDGRAPTTEGLLKDIQRPQVAQPRDAFSQPRRDPRPLKELRIGLEAPQMSPEVMHRLVTEGWLPEPPCEHHRPGPPRPRAPFDRVPPPPKNRGRPQRP